MSLLDSFIHLLELNPVLMLFLILGGGYLIGGIRFGAFSLGPVPGVLFVGLFLGHFGLRITPGAQSVGFALFIFSVGYQAGPRFFSAVKEDGLKYFALSLVVAVSALVLAAIASKLLALEPGFSAGLLAGGLTSSPTLAAAQEAIRDGTVTLATELTPDEIIGNVATAYAITYIFGLTGLITILKFMPRILKMDLVAESKHMEKEHSAELRPINITTRRYRVSNEEATRLSISELKEKYCERIPVFKATRGGEPIVLKGSDHLQIGDEVELIAPREFFTSGIHALGEEIPPDRSIAQTNDTAQIVVTNKDVLGLTLGELNIPQSFGVLISDITQIGVKLPHSYDLQLKKGDVLTVVGASERIDAFGEYMGAIERNISETDMVTFAFGICAGVLVGMLSITVGGIELGLGTAGGLLASGLAIGYLRSIRPTFGRLPEGARWVLMEFGLLLFMAGVGLRAGGNFLETLAATGPSLILAGIIVTVVPIVIAYLFGSKILKLRAPILMGALTGAMTSGASLSVVTGEAKSMVPAIGYAGTYAFGNVLLMIAGPLILLF